MLVIIQLCQIIQFIKAQILMNIYICTFIIKLHSVRLKENKRENKRFNTTLTANIQNQHQENIAISPKRPIVINGTAWFNEKFEIKSDIVQDQTTKKLKESKLCVEIVRQCQNIKTSHRLSLNLADIYEKKVIEEKWYKLQGGGGVQVNLQLSCFENVNETMMMGKKMGKPPKLKRTNTEQILQEQEFKTALKPSQQGDFMERSNTPSFGLNDRHLISSGFVEMEVIFQNTLNRVQSQENPNFIRQQMKRLQFQLKQQRSNTIQQKQKIATYTNNQMRMQCQIATLTSQLQQSQLLNHHLSVTISQKQTDIVELKQELHEIQQKHSHTLQQRNKGQSSIEEYQRNRQQEVSELTAMIKQFGKKNEESQRMVQIYKSQLSKHINICTQHLETIDRQKKQKQNHLKDLSSYKQKAKTLEKQNNLLQQALTKSENQNQKIKFQIFNLRDGLGIEEKRKLQQQKLLSQKYDRLYARYSQLADIDHNREEVVSKQLYMRQVNLYEEKIMQYEQKQQTLRKQINIIQEEMSSTYELLDQKEEREEMLIDHIKRIEEQIEIIKIQKQFWQNILPRDENRQPKEVRQNGKTLGTSQQITSLQQKNNKLLNMLKKHSKGILQTQKLHRELSYTNKRSADLLQQNTSLKVQLKQLKERINILMKQNKKLLDKNHKITRHSENETKSTKHLEEELRFIKIKHKEIKDDYDIIVHQVTNIKKEHTRKASQIKARSSSKSPNKIIHKNQPQAAQKGPKSQRSKSFQIQKPSQKQNTQGYVQDLRKLLSERKEEDERLSKHVGTLLQARLEQKKIDLQGYSRRMSMLLLKMKKSVSTSGNQNLIIDLQGCIQKITQQFENIFIKI